MEINRNARRGYRTWLKSVRRKETGFHGPGLVCGAVAIFALLWPTLTKAAREFDWFGLLLVGVAIWGATSTIGLWNRCERYEKRLRAAGLPTD